MTLGGVTRAFSNDKHRPLARLVSGLSWMASKPKTSNVICPCARTSGRGFGNGLKAQKANAPPPPVGPEEVQAARAACYRCGLDGGETQARPATLVTATGLHCMTCPTHCSLGSQYPT